MITFEDLDGLEIVGYRYGEAPESGRSYNTRDHILEPGVSMAKVGYNKEVRSFAADAQKANKKFYYKGRICGETGSDDEICLRDVERITYKEYLDLLKSKPIVYASNNVVDAYADRQIRLANKGFIGYSIEAAEEFRKTYRK